MTYVVLILIIWLRSLTGFSTVKSLCFPFQTLFVRYQSRVQPTVKGGGNEAVPLRGRSHERFVVVCENHPPFIRVVGEMLRRCAISSEVIFLMTLFSFVPRETGCHPSSHLSVTRLVDLNNQMPQESFFFGCI